jgi:hypothetical protein
MFNAPRIAGSFITVLALGAGIVAAKSPVYYTAPLPDPFHSYIVSVKSLQLLNTAGAKVEVAPYPISLDLAQIVDLDEAVNEGLIPAGDYTAATLVIDFAKAEITAPGANGSIVKLQPLDSFGNPITGTRTVTMKLDGYRHFVVSQRTAALQALDPRLVASNTAYVSNGTVTITDSWAATVVPSGNQWVRLSGGLSAVSGATTAFTLAVSSRRAYNTAATGDIKLLGTPTTSYTIGGRVLAGAAGELALATYPKGTSVTATGSLQPDRKTLIASIVVVN